MCGPSVRVEHHKVATTLPDEFFTRQKVFDLIRISRIDIKVFYRDICKSALRIVRVNGDQNQYDIVQSFGCLGVEQYLFVFYSMKTEVFVLMQSTVIAPDRVQLCDVFLDVAGR